MLSLDDKKSKDIANVLSNESCRKILDFLAEHSSSESDIAKSLNLPASTINYNIKLLQKSNLVEVKDFFWSEKGNKVNVYQAAKKFIVIAPKGSKLTSQLKNIVPVALISLIASGLLYFYKRSPQIVGEKMLAQGAAREVALYPVAYSEPNLAFWFLSGAIFSIVIYIIYILIRSRE